MENKINIETKLDTYKAQIYAYVLTLRDIRNVGLLVFVVILLLISWSGIKTIQTNYGLEKQISQLKQEDAVQSLENTNTQLQNQYYTTNQYLELTARENFGLGVAGETELLVPKNVALSYTVAQPKTTAEMKDTTTPKQPVWQRNFESWMDFFLHRNVSD